METNRPFVLWLTGLSGSGKTTLAVALKEKLSDHYPKVHHLDGDEVRAASKELLGFDKAGRDKNIQLAIALAKQYQEEGYVVLASFISPYRHHRQWGRETLADYIEVFVDTPLEICEQRDPKGLYKKARSGQMPFFTGISDPYEDPLRPDIRLANQEVSLEENVENVLCYLQRNHYLSSHAIQKSTPHS